MDPNPERKEALFEAAGQLASPAERAAYLDTACGDDRELRRQVEAMLENEAGAEEFFRAIDSLGDSVRELMVETPAESAGQIAEGPGTVIGRYQLIERIGEGGFGVVYLAAQREPVVRQVALKLIKPGLDTREVAARFEAERQALALMDHPNIARVLDGGATETGRPYFVMDLVRGLSITEFCDANQLAPRARLELLIQICHAVQHAHQKGIIHRDLKPSNVLVATDDSHSSRREQARFEIRNPQSPIRNQESLLPSAATARHPHPAPLPPWPMVIDFGIAKALNQRLTARTLVTRQDQLMGTPEYMSPEQADGRGVEVDTRSDVYSLGALLYELLTGTPPFEREIMKRSSLEEIRRMIRETEPARPSTRLKTLGARATDVARDRHIEPVALSRLLRGDLDWIVMKCLEKDRTRRYETAAALAQDLERHLNHEPVTAVAPTTRYLMARFIRRHRAGLAVTAALFALLTAGVIVSTWQMVRARKAEQQAEAVSAFLVEAFRSPDPGVDGRRVTVAEVLDRATTNLMGRFAEAPARKATLLQALAETYHSLGLDESAEKLASDALALRRHVLGPEDPDTLRSLIYVAGIRTQQDRLDEAEMLDQETLELCQRVLGPAHTNTIEARIILQVCYLRQHRLDDAERLGKETCELTQRLLPVDHPCALMAGENLASVYLRQDRLDEARPLYEAALKTRRAVGLTNTSGAFGAMNDLAAIAHLQGRLEEAATLFQQVLEIQSRVLSPEHPATLTTLFNLASTCRQQGTLEQAEELLEQSLRIHRRALGQDHPDTQHTMIWLSYLQERQGNLDGAIALRFEHIKLVAQWAERYTQLFALICQVQPEAKRAALLSQLVDLCADGFAQHPKLSESPRNSLHYTAARAAACAAAGRIEENNPTAAATRVQRRQQALAWLRADLARWTRQWETNEPVTSLRIEDALGRWQRSPALASIRDVEALNEFSEGEQEHFASLWDDVASLRHRASQRRGECFQSLLAKGSSWAYWDDGSAPGPGWREAAFNDAAWLRGRSPLGYGDLALAKEIGFGSDPKRKHVTTYFRTTFTVARPEDCSRLVLWLRRNDGVIIYLNGQEVLRDNLAQGARVAPYVLATDVITEYTEPVFHLREPDTNPLRPGTNTVAVEVHQAGWASPDLAFDLEILAQRKN